MFFVNLCVHVCFQSPSDLIESDIIYGILFIPKKQFWLKASISVAAPLRTIVRFSFFFFRGTLESLGPLARQDPKVKR